METFSLTHIEPRWFLPFLAGAALPRVPRTILDAPGLTHRAVGHRSRYVKYTLLADESYESNVPFWTNASLKQLGCRLPARLQSLRRKSWATVPLEFVRKG